MLDNIWFTSAIWMGLALISALISIRLAISVALIEIIVGAIAGNSIGLKLTPYVDYLAGTGAIFLTFLAGAELDPAIIKKHFWSSISIGAMGFFAPFIGAFLYAYFVSGWNFNQAAIAGISLSCTSVAVVYAVMLETGYNRTDLGKLILAACFINDIGTVVALGIFFARYDLSLILFSLITALLMWILPKIAPWFFKKVGNKISEPEIKFIFFILFFLGGLSNIAKSEAVLPAYLIGMVLAPFFLKERVLAQRIRVITFALLTPFYFLKAGSFVKIDTVISDFGLIVIFLAVKMLTKFVGILPLTVYFKFQKKEGMYTTLLMCTGLTFGSIAALFGLTNKIIDQDQYTVLITVIIASAVVPTLVAQQWFQPEIKIKEEVNNV